MPQILFLFIISATLIVLINLICNKFNFLIYKPTEEHKEHFKNKIFNSGGLIFFFYIVILNIYNLDIKNLDLFYTLYFFLIFIIGFLSDVSTLSAKIRLLIISILTLFFFYFSENYIWDLKFDILNNLFISYSIITIIFTSICFVVLINGINFIDGVHGLSILYTIIVIVFLSYFTYFTLNSEIFLNESIYLIPILLCLFYLNIKEKIFFGDTGSYLAGAILGYYVIKITNTEGFSYPYVYANLLIYPAFEVFFSIFRKIIINVNPLLPDKKHLHHLIQEIFLRRKINLKNSKIFSGIIINFIVVFFNIFSIFMYEKKYILITNIFLFCFFYLFLYLFLKRRLKY
tara:strand:- start:3851 stop:4885 length:1035 start_codon:yes stop_codon:yes gene_type:complete